MNQDMPQISSIGTLTKRSLEKVKTYIKPLGGITLLYAILLFATATLSKLSVGLSILAALSPLTLFIAMVYTINIVNKKNQTLSQAELIKKSLKQTPGFLICLVLVSLVPGLLFYGILLLGLIPTVVISLTPLPEAFLALVWIPLIIFAFYIAIKKSLGYMLSDYIYLYEQQRVRTSMKLSTTLINGRYMTVFKHFVALMLPLVVIQVIFSIASIPSNTRTQELIEQGTYQYQDLVAQSTNPIQLLLTISIFIWAMYAMIYGYELYKDLVATRPEALENLKERQPLLRPVHLILTLIYFAGIAVLSYVGSNLSQNLTELQNLQSGEEFNNEFELFEEDFFDDDFYEDELTQEATGAASN